MDKSEIERLSAFLARVLESPGLVVKARSREDADLLIEGAPIASISKEVDEGETSYTLSLLIPRARGAAKTAAIDPPERTRLQTVLRETLKSPRLEARARPRKVDSAEVYVGDEFLGTLSVDEDEGHFFVMSILDIDLEDGDED